MGLFRKKPQNTQESAENTIVQIIGRINKLELIAERFDQEFIQKLINRCTDAESRIQKLTSGLDLQEEKLTKFMARTSARAASKSPDTETAAQEKAEQMLEEAVKKGFAVPLDEKQETNGKKHKNKKRVSRFRRKAKVVTV